MGRCAEVSVNRIIRNAAKATVRGLARTLPNALAVQLFKELAWRYSVPSITADGLNGRFESNVDLTMGRYISEKSWAPGLLRLACSVLRDGGTYLDLGCNIGMTLIPVARAVDVECIGFEPAPKNFELLRRNVAGNLPASNRVVLHQKAVYSSPGTISFGISPTNAGDCRVVKTRESGSYGEEDWDVIPVEAVRLDDAVNAAELCHPILVKMDVQGAESSVIAGGPRLFAAADYVITEFWPYGMKRLGADPQAMIDLVGSFPYAAFLSDSSTARPELGSAAVVAEELSRSLSGETPARFYRDVFLARGALPAD